MARRRLGVPALAVAVVALGLSAVPAPAEGPATLRGHGGPVMGIDVAQDGRVATASFDNAVGLWDAPGTGGDPTWLDGHEAAVNRVLFLPGGGLVSASDDFTLRVWDGTEARVLAGHQGKVMGLAATDGLIASASWDGTIGLWPRDGGEPRFLKGHDGAVNDVAFAPDGRLYSASADGTIRLWDPATGGAPRTLVSHGFGVNALVLDLSRGHLVYGAVDGGTRIVDAETGAEIADYTAERRPILALALDPAGGHLAVGDGEGFVMVIDLAEGRIAHDFRAARQGPIWALHYTADGGTLLAAGLAPVVQGWPVDDPGAGVPLDTDAAFLADPATMSNGKRQFARKCSICHSLTPGSARKAGPTLHDLFGREAGSVPDYAYSDYLDDSDLVWTAETVDKLFDLGPDHYVPGSKMPMQRIAGAGDRADLIAYLQEATRPEERTR